MGDGWIVDFKKRIGRLSKPDLYVRVQKSKSGDDTLISWVWK